MPQIVEYDDVRQTLLEQGLVSLYHNSGAFGFPKGAKVQVIGWVGPDDPTLRAEARALIHHVAEPFAENLARLLTRAWREIVPGPVWVMPMSHWAYELDFASRAWMPGLLECIGVNPQALESRNDGSAIQFSDGESPAAEILVAGLLTHLSASDFALAFPQRAALCTIHHHAQLWWTTTDDAVAASLRSLV